MNDKVKKLIRDLAEVTWLGGGLDGGEIQDMLVEAGALVETTVDKPCGANCNCAGVVDFPTICYRLAEDYK